MKCLAYLTASVVVQLNDASKTKLFDELGFGSEALLETFITTYIIPGIEAHAAQLSGGAYTDATVPAMVKLVAYQAACNVLSYMRTNKMGPVIANPAGFNLQVPITQAFTDDLKEALHYYRARIVVPSAYQTSTIYNRDWATS